MSDFQAYSLTHKVNGSDWNYLLDHGLVKSASYIIDKSGTKYRAINGSTGKLLTSGIDVSVVMLAACSALYSTGGIVHVKKGVYEGASYFAQILAGSAPITIKGDGIDQTILNANASWVANREMVQVRAPNCVVEDLTLKEEHAGTRLVGSGVDGSGAYVLKLNRVKFNNTLYNVADFSTFWGHIVELGDNCHHFTMKECETIGGTFSVHCDNPTGNHNFRILDNDFYYNGQSNFIYLNVPYNVWVKRNRLFSHVDFAIEVDGCENAWITDNEMNPDGRNGTPMHIGNEVSPTSVPWRNYHVLRNKFKGYTSYPTQMIDIGPDGRFINIRDNESDCGANDVPFISVRPTSVFPGSTYVADMLKVIGNSIISGSGLMFGTVDSVMPTRYIVRDNEPWYLNLEVLDWVDHFVGNGLGALWTLTVNATGAGAIQDNEKNGVYRLRALTTGDWARIDWNNIRSLFHAERVRMFAKVKISTVATNGAVEIGLRYDDNNRILFIADPAYGDLAWRVRCQKAGVGGPVATTINHSVNPVLLAIDCYDYPALGIDFYIDGVLAKTITDVTTIPVVQLQPSLQVGASVATEKDLDIDFCRVWQQV